MSTGPRYVDRAIAGARRQHYDQLTPQQKVEAIQRLARGGMTDHGIASATGLSVEMVRQVIDDPSSKGRRE